MHPLKDQRKGVKYGRGVKYGVTPVIMYVCIAELLVYCRRMGVRSDNELKVGIYKCVIIKLMH